MIRLGNCFDLIDPANVQSLKGLHDDMVDRWKAKGIEPPRNVRHRKYLDCAVFNYYYEKAMAKMRPIDSARAVYVPADKAKRVWEGSWIYEEAHIQICVRNPKNILAVWHVDPEGRYGKGGR